MKWVTGMSLGGVTEFPLIVIAYQVAGRVIAQHYDHATCNAVPLPKQVPR